MECMAATVTVLTWAFHSSDVLGITFQVGVSGAAIIFFIYGLTVSGTGIDRAGISRGPCVGVCAIPSGVESTIAIEMATAPATRRRLTCARVFKLFPPNTYGYRTPHLECE
jgi:hypothetical protein